MRPVSRRQWKAAITTAVTLTPTTRLALLSLADECMSPGGQFVRGIEKLAGGDKSRQRRLARYLQAAYEAGWLLQTSPGYSHHAAVYAAVIPDPGECQQRRPRGGKRMTSSVTHSDGKRMTLHSNLTDPKKDDILLSSHKELYYASDSEHLAFNHSATGKHTKNALAAFLAATAETTDGHDEGEAKTTPGKHGLAGLVTTTSTAQPPPSPAQSVEGRTEAAETDDVTALLQTYARIWMLRHNLGWRTAA